MKGIILAGGEGTRLRPVTFEIPKPLITIKKKPLINYGLDLFTRHGVNDIKILIRPSDEKDYERWYREFGGDFPHAKIELVQEPLPMGTLGYFFHHLQEWANGEDVFIANGDDLVTLDLAAMHAFHRKTDGHATVALMRMEDPGDYGTVRLDGGKVTAFLEKEKNMPAGLVSAGVYVISAKALGHIGEGITKAQKFLMFEKDMFPILAAAGKLSGFVSEGTFYDCGTFERWERAIREV